MCTAATYRTKDFYFGRTLDYDFSEEKKFSYKNLSMDEIIRRLAVFIFGLGQIHVFSDGNITRQYLEMFWKSL